MRRAMALLLVLFFSSLLMAPLFASDPDANLPPCCRRHGKHHCAMRTAQQQDGRPRFTSVREKCPCFPAGTCASHSPQFQPESGRWFHPAALSAGSIARHTDAGFRLAFSLSHPKRGPPVPLA